MSVRQPQTPEEWAIRRAQWRESKRRQRARQLQRLQGGRVCRVALGPYAVCLGPLVEEVDRIGRVVVRCPRCERRRSGVCQTCPRRVYGKVGWALYCAPCKKRVAAAQNAKWVRNNRERKNASVRAWRNRQRAA